MPHRHVQELNEAMYKWHVQQKAFGSKVTLRTIKNGFEQLSKHTSIQCNACDGWLWHFCNVTIMLVPIGIWLHQPDVSSF